MSQGRTDGSVVIVVVNWNGRALLEACLGAALAQRYPAPFEVVVVDNLSSDDSVAFVQQRFPRVRVLVNDANNYSRANNRGAALADSEFIALLNTDAEPNPDWLARLVACLREEPRCGAATGLVRFPDGRINSTGIETLPGFHWRDRDFGAPRESGRAAGEVEGVSGCAVLWRRQCWAEIGGLDEDFEMYYEDVDASLRARARGWQLRFCPDAEVTHHYNTSIKQREQSEAAATQDGASAFALKDRFGERNRLLILARHFRPSFVGELATSRFFLDASEVDLARGLDLALARWCAGTLAPPMRADLTHVLLVSRRLIAERAAWARQAEVEVGKRELQIVDLLGKLDALAVRCDHLRQRAEGLARELQAEQERNGALATEVQRLNQEIATIHTGYQAESKRVHEELAHVHAGYQTAIRARDDALAELRRALAPPLPATAAAGDQPA